MLKLEIVDDELPYRVEIDSLFGAGISPSGAVMAALSAGGRRPSGNRDRKAFARYLLWYFEPNPDWVKLISILENDTFEGED